MSEKQMDLFHKNCPSRTYTLKSILKAQRNDLDVRASNSSKVQKSDTAAKLDIHTGLACQNIYNYLLTSSKVINPSKEKDLIKNYYKVRPGKVYRLDSSLNPHLLSC